MKRYHYATVDGETFLQASRVPPPGPDAYIAQDQQTGALRDLLQKGYRFVTLDNTSNLAVFEKELPLEDSREIVKSMNRQEAVRDLIAGVEQAIEHAEKKDGVHLISCLSSKTSSKKQRNQIYETLN